MAKQKNQQEDSEVQMMGDYNQVSPTQLPDSELEEYYRNTPPSLPPSLEDEDDGKAHRRLNFDSSFFHKLKQYLANNLNRNNQMANDATTQLVDRARMATNPNIQGPPLPNQSMPEELNYSQAMGQGVMGIAGKPVIAKSAPWMKNLTEGSVKEAIPTAEGLVNSTKNNIYTQAVKAQNFERLKKLLKK